MSKRQPKYDGVLDGVRVRVYSTPRWERLTCGRIKLG